MQLSAAFATTLATPDHVRIAEQLGYDRAWLYDTPQQSPDVWMVLALAAERTTTIGLGPGVLVPTLRHPMVNAAGAAALARMAPERVVVAFGTGYTGRRALGQPKPIPWAYMTRYITAFRSLLRGEIADWEGAPMQMLHPDDAGDVPVEIPVYVAALGPKGLDVARSLGDGIFVASNISTEAPEFDAVACLVWGTVVNDTSRPDDELRAAAGPGLAQTYHGAYEIFGRDIVTTLPGGAEWLAVVEAAPEHERHLAVHRGHCLELNDADAAAWDAGAGELAESVTLTGPVEAIRATLDDYAQRGVTEVVYQPAGDIPRELEAFAAVRAER